MIIVIHGEDSFRARRHLNTLILNFKEKYDSCGLNLSKIDGPKATFETLSKEFSSIPFLAKKRMVVIENFLQKNRLDEPKEVIDYISKIENSIIIFFENANLKKNEFVKILSRKRPRHTKASGGKKGDIYIYEYSILCGYDLKQWIHKETKNLGANIEPAAVEILSQNIGGDLWRMFSELQKLAAYCLKKKIITRTDAQLMISNKLEENIFALTDALGNKDIKTSLKLFREMMELDPNKTEYILTMLIRQFRILIETKDFLKNRPHTTRDDVAQKFNLHPFVATKALIQAKKFELEELKKIYAKILEFENKQKTGYIKPTLMFDLLTMSLS